MKRLSERDLNYWHLRELKSNYLNCELYYNLNLTFINNKLKKQSVLDSEWQDMVLINFKINIQKEEFGWWFLWSARNNSSSIIRPFAYQLLLDRFGPDFVKNLGDAQTQRIIESICYFIDKECELFRKFNGINRFKYKLPLYITTIFYS